MSTRETPFDEFRPRGVFLPARHARQLNRMAEAAERASGFRGPHTYLSSEGHLLAGQEGDSFYGKLTDVDTTGSVPKYSWRRVVPDGAGKFYEPPDQEGGNDFLSHPAYEANGRLVAVPSYVRLYWAETNYLTFFSSNAGVPIPAVLTGCEACGDSYSWHKVKYAGSGEWTIDDAVPEVFGSCNAWERNGRPAPVIVKYGDDLVGGDDSDGEADDDGIGHNTVVWLWPQVDGSYVFDIELENFPAQVMGPPGTSIYSFIEHYPPGTPLENGRQGLASEMNGVTGANGRIVQIFVYGKGCNQVYYFAWENPCCALVPAGGPPGSSGGSGGSGSSGNPGPGNIWVDCDTGILYIDQCGIVWCLPLQICGSSSGSSGSGSSGGCCPEDDLGDVLHVSFTADACAGLPADMDLHRASGDVWEGTTAGLFVRLICRDGNWDIQLLGTCVGNTAGTRNTASCGPLDVTFTFTGEPNGCCLSGWTGSATITA